MLLLWIIQHSFHEIMTKRKGKRVFCLLWTLNGRNCWVLKIVLELRSFIYVYLYTVSMRLWLRGKANKHLPAMDIKWHCWVLKIILELRSYALLNFQESLTKRYLCLCSYICLYIIFSKYSAQSIVTDIQASCWHDIYKKKNIMLFFTVFAV